MKSRIKKEPIIAEMNLYDMNKQIIDQLPTPTEEQIIEYKKIISDVVTASGAEYFMMLCREENYFTLFNLSSSENESMLDILFNECIPNFGNLKCINITKDQSAVEIWAKVNDEVRALYLFPYDNGVIKCKI